MRVSRGLCAVCVHGLFDISGADLGCVAVQNLNLHNVGCVT